MDAGAVGPLPLGMEEVVPTIEGGTRDVGTDAIGRLEPFGTGKQGLTISAKSEQRQE